MGYDDSGYVLPEMQVIYHKVDVDHSTAGFDKDKQVKLFRDAALGLKEAAKEKRDSLPYRIKKMTEILDAAPDDHFVIWHDLEVERHAIKKRCPRVPKCSDRRITRKTRS